MRATIPSSVIIVILVSTSITDTRAAHETLCYRCTATRPPKYSLTDNEPVRLCSEFDYSERFVVECPDSTYCMKRFFTARIKGGVNLTERDCANQKRETQNYHNGTWRREYIIEEPYREGCATVNDHGTRTSTTIDCYCKGWLCNRSPTVSHRSTILLLVVISLIRNVMY